MGSDTKAKSTSEADTLSVVTGSGSTRGSAKNLKVEELTVNVNLFLDQMSKVLNTTPEKIGKFHFEEFEVHAEISAKGTLSLLGSGGEVQGAGGLRFVFRRSPASSDGK